jgi:hypothetical protein
MTSCWKSLPEQHFSERWPCLNPVPIREIYGRRVGKFERQRSQALDDLKEAPEQDADVQA